MLVATAESKFGGIDVLVNNGDIFTVDQAEATSLERWNRILAINLTAAFLAMRQVLPGMKARRFGRIVNIASALGLVGQMICSAYAASKHGIVGVTRSVALETAEHGITVNAVCPGYVRTPLVESEIMAMAASRGISEAAAAAEIILASKKFQEVDIKRPSGQWQKGYIIKRYKFDNLPSMILVHYMGQLLMDDEFIPESKESERIRPRTKESYIGDVGISDQTSDSLESFYTESMMSNYDIEAKTAATAATSPPPTDHITAPELPTTPNKVEDEIKAINTLYEKHDKKAEKVQKIIDLKKSFNAKIKSLATLLLDMYKKSLESYATWKKHNPRYQKVTKRNLYSH